jgi:hypothetical protein
MVVHPYNSSYARDGVERIVVTAQPRQKHETMLKNN